MEIVQKGPTNASFVFANETHTVLCLLQTELLRNPEVLTAGFEKVHPLSEKMVLDVRTLAADPVLVFNRAVDSLVDQVKGVRRAFDQAQSAQSSAM